MLFFNISREQAYYAEDLLKNANFGSYVDGGGNYDQQKTGIIGETVMADLLSQPRPTSKPGTGDNGIDFLYKGVTIDVKTMSRTVDMEPHFEHNISGRQIKFSTDIYIFCSINRREKTITICGWILKRDFLEKAKFYKHKEKIYRDNGTYFTVRGKDGIYCLANSHLHNIESLEQFDQDVKIVHSLILKKEGVKVS